MRRRRERGWDDAGREDALLLQPLLCAVNWLGCISGSADDGREGLSNPAGGCGGAGSVDGTSDSSELEESGKCSALWEDSSWLPLWWCTYSIVLVALANGGGTEVNCGSGLP